MILEWILISAWIKRKLDNRIPYYREPEVEDDDPNLERLPREENQKSLPDLR